MPNTSILNLNCNRLLANTVNPKLSESRTSGNDSKVTELHASVERPGCMRLLNDIDEPSRRWSSAKSEHPRQLTPQANDRVPRYRKLLDDDESSNLRRSRVDVGLPGAVIPKAEIVKLDRTRLRGRTISSNCKWFVVGVESSERDNPYRRSTSSNQAGDLGGISGSSRMKSKTKGKVLSHAMP
jgi:hypothetical protein